MISIRFRDITGDVGKIEKETHTFEQEIQQIFKWYSVQAVLYFNAVQTSAPAEAKGAFWTNHTFKAARAFFTDVIYIKNDSITLKFAYDQEPEYVKYLEYYNDERFAALPTMLERFAPMMIRDLKSLFGDG